MLNDWSHKVRAILKYCPGNIKKILPSLSQSGNTRFYFGHQKLCMDNNKQYCTFIRALSQKSLYQVCVQIDPESYEWGLSVRSVELKGNPQRRMILGELNSLLRFSSVSL